MQTVDLTGLDLLLVDDDPLLRSQMAAYLEKSGADVSVAKDLASARRLIQDLTFDFVLLDVSLPDGEGTELLREKIFPAGTGVIVATGGGTISGAVEAVQLGAADYLVKPFDLRELPLVINAARRMKRSARIEEHRRKHESGTKGAFFFGRSLAPLEAQLAKILASDRRMEKGLPPVLILGETGTGKSTIARLLHHDGPRAGASLVEVNCSALPEQLAESELFGHERGAFTDARSARMGLFEAANGGTLFLDEVASLSPNLQAKLLTAIEDGIIRRLGGNKPIPVDVRLVAAANRDLKEMIAQGQFREDLYHRLDLFRVVIPPLRERGQDMLDLAELLLDQLCKRHRIGRKRLQAGAVRKIRRYPWPGNVRELAHELERAIVFEEREELALPHLPDAAADAETRAGEPPHAQWFQDPFAFPENFSLEQAIQNTIEKALRQMDNNVSAAARLLGVPRDYVRYRMSKKGTGAEDGRS